MDWTLDGATAELIIPASASSLSAQPFGLGHGGSSASRDRERGMSRFGGGLYRSDDGDQHVLDDDPGFAFDAEGNLIEGAPEERMSIMRAMRTPSIVARDGSRARSEMPGVSDAVRSATSLPSLQPLLTF